MDAVLNCLVTDSVGPGEFLDRLHKVAKEGLGFDAGIALRSPHAALGLALDALGLASGDAVLLSALSPIYYLDAIKAKGLLPLVCDVREDLPLPSSASAAEAIASAEVKPKAFVLFEAAGLLPDFEDLQGLGLPIIEDISQSLGAYRGETRAGGFGLLAFLGMEHDAIATAGGGAILFAPARREGTVLRNLSERVPPELHMTDYNAALGWAQLKELGNVLERRRELYGVLSQSIARGRHKRLSQDGEGEPGYYAFPVSLASGMKEVRAYAKKKEVETSVLFEGSFAARTELPEGAYPRARSFVNRGLGFPLHQRIGASGAQKLARVLATLP